MDDSAWLEGHISVQAALDGDWRDVETLFLRRGKWDSGTRRLLAAAEAAGVTVERVDDAFIAEHASGSTHGGVLARVGPRRFTALDDLLTGQTVPFVAMLDGVEDPFNFGQAVRALYAAGAGGLVLRPRNWTSAAGVVARASAGASELMPIAIANTAADAAAFFRERGLRVACATREGAVSIYAADLAQPLFLLIGGERRGVTRSFVEQSDLRLQIPYGRSFSQSLGVAASAAILAFEVMRQRDQS